MSHGLLWLPLLVAFVVLTALGWLERRRQRLFMEWASESELSKLDGGGAPASPGPSTKQRPPAAAATADRGSLG